MTRFLLLAVCGLAWLASPAAFSQPAKDAKSGGAVNLVFLGDKQPVLMRISVLVDDKPIDAYWGEYLKKWFDFLDRDGDGKLNDKEVQHALRDQVMMQLMRQGFLFQQPNQQPLRMADFNKDVNDRITLEDFTRYYSAQKAGAIQVGGGFGGQSYNPTGDTLLKLLDRDGDGQLSKQELTGAVDVLRKLDIDDDEYVTTQEVTPANNQQFGRVGFVQPPQPAQPAQASKTFYTVTADLDVPLAMLLLATYDKDKSRSISRKESGMPRDLFDLVDRNKNGELDVAELSLFHRRAADFAYTVRLGKTEGAPVELGPVSSKKLASQVAKVGDSQIISLEGAQVQVLRENTNRDNTRFRVNQFQQVFRLADTKKQGYVELKDLQQNRQFQFLIQMFPVVDRNSDGKMTEKELQAFMDLQGEATACFATLSIAEYGRNLLKLLDANGDNRLSLRELKTAWTRLKDLDVDGDGSIGPGELARQFQLIVDRGGQPGAIRPVVVRQPGFDANPPRAFFGPSTPMWFKKMDRNGDGDVSEREFLGTPQEFVRIDADSDGLISPEEAESFEEKLREKK